MQSFPEVNVNAWDAIIVNLLLRKLDKETLEAWTNERPQREIATLKPLLEFLTQPADGKERQSSKMPKAQTASKPNRSSEGAVGYTPPQASSNEHSQSHAQHNQQMKSRVKVPVKCALCGGEHQLFSCNTFRKLPVDQRIRRARQFQL